MARDEGRPVRIQYDRDGPAVRFQMENVDTAELRTYILALWLVLGTYDPTARVDMIRELAHYHEAPKTVLPPVAQAIYDGYKKA